MPRQAEEDLDQTRPPTMSTGRSISGGGAGSNTTGIASGEPSSPMANSRRRRAQRKAAKYGAPSDGTETTASSPSTEKVYSRPSDTGPTVRDTRVPPVPRRGELDDEEEDIESPGAIAMLGPNTQAETNSQFGDLSTLTPQSFQTPREGATNVPIAAELVLDRGSGNNLEEVVAEVLRQQRATTSSTPGTGLDTTYASPPPPGVAQAVVVEQKMVCGGRIPLTMCLIGSVLLILFASLATTLGVVFAEGGSRAALPLAQSPTPAPLAIQSPTRAPQAIQNPTRAPQAIQNPTPAPQATQNPTPAPQATKSPTPAPQATKSPTPAPQATQNPTPVTGGISFQTTLTGRSDDDSFGTYVEFSRDGNTLAVGATGGYVRVFRALTDSSTWVRIGQTITGSGTFGHRVDISANGQVLVIGAPRNDDAGTNSGLVEVYEYNGSDTWVRKGNKALNGLTNEDYFGWDVAISDDGNTIVCTARLGDINSLDESGYVQVFNYDSSTNGDWVQLGPTLLGEATGDQFGRSCGMSSDGRRIAVGAVHGGGGKGRIYVYDYKNDLDSWDLVGQVLDGEADADWQGTSVDLSGDGNFLAIGSDGHDQNGSNSGVVKIYELIGCCSWTQYGNFVYGENEGDQLGAGQISLSTTTKDKFLAVASSHHSGNQGKAYLYQFVSGKWLLIDDERGDSDGDRFGFAVNVAGDGSRFAVGATRSSSADGRPGFTRIYGINQQQY